MNFNYRFATVLALALVMASNVFADHRDAAFMDADKKCGVEVLHDGQDVAYALNFSQTSFSDVAPLFNLQINSDLRLQINALSVNQSLQVRHPIDPSQSYSITKDVRGILTVISTRTNIGGLCDAGIGKCSNPDVMNATGTLILKSNFEPISVSVQKHISNQQAAFLACTRLEKMNLNY